MKTEFKGTKGEWELIPTYALNENGKPLFYDICIGNQSFISTFRNKSIGLNDKTQLANAKIISCAPELLEALNEAVSLLYGTTEFEVLENYRKKINDFEQLITKATRI